MVEFAYNNSFHASLGMAPFEALYRRKCRTPISWDKVEDRVVIGLEMLREMDDQMRLIKEKLKQAVDRQKIYADKNQTFKTFVT